MIVDIAHICLGAANLAETEQFYCQVLGLRKTFDFICAGKCIGFYLEVTRGRYIEVFQADSLEASDRHPIRHLCLQVDDMDALRRNLVSGGAEVTGKTLGADHSWQMWTTDPNGVRIEFHQYTPESCQLTGEPCILD